MCFTSGIIFRPAGKVVLVDTVRLFQLSSTSQKKSYVLVEATL